MKLPQIQPQPMVHVRTFLNIYSITYRITTEFNKILEVGNDPDPD